MRVLRFVPYVAVMCWAMPTLNAATITIPGFPTTGYLSNRAANGEGLVYECRLAEVREPTIKCDFTRMLVAYRTNPDELVPELSRIKQASGEPGGDLTNAVITTLSQCSNLASNVPYQNAAAILHGADAGPTKRAAAASLVEYVDNLCATMDQAHGLEDLNATIRSTLELQAKTCHVWVNTWEQTYQYQPGDSSWVSRTGPEGDCGITVASTFSLDPEDSLRWILEATTTVSNKDGRPVDPLGCATFDDRHDVYVLESNGTDMNCEVITFGP